MKLFITFLTLICFSVNGQLIEKVRVDLEKVRTVHEANDYLARHSFVGELFELNSATDTTALDAALTSSVPGSLIYVESEDKTKYFIFKTLEASQIRSFRVQYIFLDNRKLTLKQIDSLRTLIMKRLGKGESFDKLAKEYSMDGNAKNGGDLGWFEEGMMRSEFEEVVKSKKQGEVFVVDVPSEQWYYVVRNSHEPRDVRKVTVLYIEIENAD